MHRRRKGRGREEQGNEGLTLASGPNIMAVPVLLNSKARGVGGAKDVRKRVAQALKRAGIDGEVELIEGGKCEVRCKAIAERGDPLVIVGGGDGTVNAAASALVGTKTVLGVLALGTLNHFARDAGIPADLDEAAALIAAGNKRRIDVGEMNERIFVNNSAIGLYPLMLVQRDLQRKRLGMNKRLAMILASVRTLSRFNHYRLTLTVNEEQTGRVDTPLLFVGNNEYRIDLGAPGRRERLDDGQLNVLVMRKKTRRGFIGASIRALLERSRPDDMVRLEGVERLRVASRERHLAVSLDGEVVRAKPPLDYRIRRKALRIIAP
jgi:diacylglycerol kinase family enzyme